MGQEQHDDSGPYAMLGIHFGSAIAAGILTWSVLEPLSHTLGFDTYIDDYARSMGFEPMTEEKISDPVVTSERRVGPEERFTWMSARDQAGYLIFLATMAAFLIAGSLLRKKTPGPYPGPTVADKRDPGLN
ncbi:MAG: hypothetical protein AAB955_01310 [Patescibacteria group bacterium]